MQKPHALYHGSTLNIKGPLTPTVFATARKDIAGLFMSPLDALVSIGFEKDIAYICIWGTAELFVKKDHGGFLYTLPTPTFQKIGKDYEWQSFEKVAPIEIKEFSSALHGILECGAQVYFIDDEKIFDAIVANEDHRWEILKTLTSYNQKINSNVRNFTP